METLLQDLRFALKMLWKRPGFSLPAILTLALGIGVTGAVFNLAMAGLFPRLPVRQSDRLVAIFQYGSMGGGGDPYYSGFSYPTYRDYAQRLSSFAGIAGYQSAAINFSYAEGSTRIEGELVSPNFFEVLGIETVRGRPFPASIEEGVDDELAVVSYALWRDRLGGDGALIGGTISLNGRRFTVTGVAPEDFRGLDLEGDVDVWVPFSTRDRILTYWRPEYGASRTSHQLSLVGRLAEGVTMGRAAEEARALAAGLAETFPEGQGGWTARVMPAAEATVWPGRRGELTNLARTLAMIVGLILGLACANVGNMLLGRVADRRGEIAMRLALGAGRSRLARQFLLESVVLVFPAALLAVVAAAWLADFLARFRVSGVLPAGLEVPMDARTLVFVVVAGGLVALVTGLAPAAHVFRWRPGTALRAEGSAGGRGGLAGLRRGLSVIQIGGSLAVLSCGGLLVRSAITLLRTDPGFDAGSVALATVDPAASGYSRADAFALYDRSLEAIESLPGIESAAASLIAPLGQRRFATGVVVDQGDESPRSVSGNVVTPGYMTTLGIPLLRGRDFREGEGERSLIVSETAARSFWPGLDPVGRGLTLPSYGKQEFTVIGVAGDARLGRRPFADIEPFIYLPMDLQREVVAGSAPALTFHVRTAGLEPADAIPLVRSVVGDLAPGLPVFDARTLRGQARAVMAPALTTATYVSILGLLGLMIAAVGIYAVIQNAVVRRTREIGVRMALGAEPGRVVRFVLGGGLRLTLIGIALGLAGGLVAGRLLRGSLPGIAPTDPLTFAAAVLVTGAVSLGAVYIPARRAARIEPQRALRTE